MHVIAYAICIIAYMYMHIHIQFQPSLHFQISVPFTLFCSFYRTYHLLPLHVIDWLLIVDCLSPFTGMQA